MWRTGYVWSSAASSARRDARYCTRSTSSSASRCRSSLWSCATPACSSLCGARAARLAITIIIIITTTTTRATTRSTEAMSLRGVSAPRRGRALRPSWVPNNATRSSPSPASWPIQSGGALARKKWPRPALDRMRAPRWKGIRLLLLLMAESNFQLVARTE